MECSERTIYRDLKILEFAGVPYYTDNKSRAIKVRSDYRFPTLNLTDDELIGQATAAVTTQAPGLDVTVGAKPVTSKLEAVSREESESILAAVQQFTHVLDLKLADHTRHHEQIKTIQAALLQRKQLVGHYKSPYEPSSRKLTLHPYRLCLVKSAWYLIGRPTDKQTPQTFRVVRFKTLRMNDAEADVPNEFDLREFFGNAWAVYRGDKTYDVELLFDQEAAELVAETVWHHSQRITRDEDGTATVTFRIDGLNEIVRWVVGWAGRVVVVEPKELRELVIQMHTRAIQKNKDQRLKNGRRHA